LRESVSIITPSYKRAGSIKTWNIFGESLIIAVHEFEQGDYREAYPGNEIMVLPDGTRGNMAKVRNYIRDNCETRYLVMVDDDIQEIGYHQQMKRIKMDLPQIKNMLQRGYLMAEDMGIILWGVNVQADPLFYRQYTPLCFLSPVLGPFSCHILGDDGVRYDEELGLNEDYDFCLQVLRKYHKILRFNKYYYLADHIVAAGGCGAYRLMGEEVRQAEIMIKKWGESVVRYDFSRSTNPRINVPLKGV